eukprot:5564931-Lingulodinium_polyedra.AAC.1
MSVSVNPTRPPLPPPGMATMTTQPSSRLQRCSLTGADMILASVPMAMSMRAPGGVQTNRRRTVK